MPQDNDEFGKDFQEAFIETGDVERALELVKHRKVMSDFERAVTEIYGDRSNRPAWMRYRPNQT